MKNSFRKIADLKEVKEFQNAMQYFKIQKYQSAIVALNNMITKYPDTEFLEEYDKNLDKSLEKRKEI